MVMKLIVVREKKTKKRFIEKNEHAIQTFLVHKFVCVCVHVLL
jgi:hypothetical protein